MIAQDIDVLAGFVKTRRIGDYDQLSKIRWRVKRQARVREFYAACRL